MTNINDDNYKETKLIKQGNRTIKPEFIELVEWINKTFDVSVLNIVYNIPDDKKNTPRLQIIFEFEVDELKFRDGRLGNFDDEKQKMVAAQFSLFVKKGTKEDSIIRKLIKRIKSLKYKTENLFVVFTSFELLAMEDINLSISEFEIKELKKELRPKLRLWKIYQQRWRIIFFFYTNKEIEEHSKDGTKEFLSKKYLNLLKVYDEFGYFKEGKYSVDLDSKENFDKTFKSSWFYYDR
jgi:hypothetical protein